MQLWGIGSSSLPSGSFAPFCWGLGFLDFLLFLDKKGIELDGLGEDDVADGAAPNSQLVELYGVLI